MDVQKTITKDNVNNMIEIIKNLDLTKPWRLTLSEYKWNRSVDQNSRYWKLLRTLSDFMGYDVDELDTLMKYKFLSEETTIGKENVLKIKSTSQLNTKEMAQYQDNIQNWAMDFGFTFKDLDG